MTVIIANDAPPAIRGLLKRWFIEPRPNVFVGSVNARTRAKTLEYIRRNGDLVEGLQQFAGAADDEDQAYAARVLAEKQRLESAARRIRRG